MTIIWIAFALLTALGVIAAVFAICAVILSGSLEDES